MTAQRRILRTAALVAGASLALAGCSGDPAATDTAADTATDATVEPTTGASESSSPAPSTSVDVPAGERTTAPGTQLAFGDPATVAYERQGKGTTLKLRVDSAEQGSLEDFAGFQLDDPLKKRGNYYYVRVAVKNVGKDTFGGVPVPLWGISGENTLLQPVEFKSSFAKCPTEPLPEKFKPEDTFKTCLVYLSPNKGELQGISYRPTEQFAPIEWRGPVDMLPKKKGKRDGKNKGAGAGSDQ